MGMITCEDCGQEISNRATTCVKCGCPFDSKTGLNRFFHDAWVAIKEAKTPINLFAIAMMSCAAILGWSATKVTNESSLTAFTYTLHAFLAVAGMFFVTILFCRKGIYHPEDLAKAKGNGLSDLGEDKPEIAAALILLMLVVYGVYQFLTQ